MASDGAIIIDTRILPDGMERGARELKKGLSSVGSAAGKAAGEIEKAFSRADVSRPIARAAAQVKRLEEQLASVSSEYSIAISDDDDKAAERLAKQRIRVYDALEAARERLASEVSKAAQKEAAAEERAAKKEAKAAEKKFNELTKPARRFNSRLREIASGTLVFNVISSGLRKVTDYFGSALNASDEYSSAMDKLRGSLLTAFQPIYESVLPAIITLINWLNTGAQVIGQFFAALSGRSYNEIQKNAQALEQQAGAIGGVGDAAEKAAKQLMGFDEINKLESVKNASGGGGGGGGTSAPVFEEIDIPSSWETAIEPLAMRIKDIAFKWDDISPELMTEKLLSALTAITGGVIGFALGGLKGGLIGMTVGAGIGMVLSNVIFNGDGNLGTDELCAALVSGLLVIGGALIGFFVGGPGGALLGATIGLGLTFSIFEATFDDVEKTYSGLAEKVSEWSNLAARTTEQGFIMPAHEDVLWLRDRIREAFEGASGDIVSSFENAARYTDYGFIIPTQAEFAETAELIKEKFTQAKEWIIDTWYSLPKWFAANITQPIENYFNGLSESVGQIWDNIARSIGKAVEEILGFFSRFSFLGGETVAMPTVYAATPALSAYSVTPEIPYLAQGAVIPANQKFLAVLGDQTSGRNLEAPESLIRQIVREESGSSEELAQLLEILIETVQGIKVGDEVIGRAATRYQKKHGRAMGG